MSTNAPRDAARSTEGALPVPLAVLAWLWVLVPFGYGVYNLVIRAQNLFG